MAQENDSGDQRISTSNHPTTRPKKAGRKQRKKDSPKNLGEILVKTVSHFFPNLSASMNELLDVRDLNRTIYPQAHLIWGGILLFLLHSKSRRQFRLERISDVFLKHINLLTHSQEESIADPDTLAYYLERQDYEKLRYLPVKMVQSLIRQKVLDRFRVKGDFLIAVDGTGQYSFQKRHCEHCLTKTHKDGKTTYYHNVLEAKLVTANGMAFSVGTVFIENPNAFMTKQDCELRAFYRLAPILKDLFPRTTLCFLLDALYAGDPVFTICKKAGWNFIINFKEGSMPALYEEAQTLKDLSRENRKATRINHTTLPEKLITQTYAWVEDLPYKDHHLKAIFSEKIISDKIIKFEYLTNLKVNYDNVDQIVNQGRHRWKIENQGFNSQKNEGYALQHVYSHNTNAAKNFYVLLQMAHIINQLMVKGSLFRDFRDQMGSLRNFAKRLAEHLRTILVPEEVIFEKFQIRFNSS